MELHQTDIEPEGMLYDPPSGWRYGFPKVYRPWPADTIEETLLRDGYPQHEIDTGGARHVRFIGSGARAVAADVGAVVVAPPANDNRGPYISTFTGRFWMTDPRPEDFVIEDVAHGLANICRYTGACHRRLSVAEHSVHITRWVKAQGGSIEEQLCALLHDAPEALSGFGDVSRPAKQLAPIIKATEENIWRLAVAPKFGLPLELPTIVHEADNRVIADEMSQNMREVDPAYTDPLGIQMEYWDERTAEAYFIATFWSLIETGRH